MNQKGDSIPARLIAAKRWQWVAAGASIFCAATFLVGWPLGYFWPSAIGFLAFIPSVWLFNTKCHACGFPAFGNHEADERLRNDQSRWTRFWGKEYGGVSLPLPSSCSKCGAGFERNGSAS